MRLHELTSWIIEGDTLKDGSTFQMLFKCIDGEFIEEKGELLPFARFAKQMSNEKEGG